MSRLNRANPRPFDALLEAAGLHPTSILASRDLTMIEGGFENPRVDPFHCPPAIAIVCNFRGDKMGAARLYYAPRPEGQRDHGLAGPLLQRCAVRP